MPKTARTTQTVGARGITVDELLAFHAAHFGAARMADESDQDAEDDAEEDDESEDESADDEVDWKAKFEAQQRISRNFERRSKKDAATIKRLTGEKPKSGTEDEAPDVEKIRADAKAEAAREVLSGRVEDKIEAKAAKFADPADAVAILLRSHDIEDFIDDGKVDVDAITDALKDLGDKKPHLLAQGKRFGGGADGGSRKAPAKERPKTLGDAVAGHYTHEKE